MKKPTFLISYATLSAFAAGLLFCLVSVGVQAADEAQDGDLRYLPGGPLAGLDLPVSPQNTGDGPEVELFPGSVEHWRGYWMKYAPMRSFFDKQSLLKRWIAAEQPGIPSKSISEYASPVYDVPGNGAAKATGKFLAPVKVVEMVSGGPVFNLDLGELEPGLYAVRVIGAVPADQIRPVREPIFLNLKINDGRDGAEREYRRACGYVDEFYNVATFYFHAPEKRRYQAVLEAGAGSKVPLLVHDICLDDVLAGTKRRAIKTRQTTMAKEWLDAVPPLDEKALKAAQAALPPLTEEERLARDEAILNWFPPLNAPVAGISVPWTPAEGGVEDKTDAEIAEEFGVWEAAGHRESMNFTQYGFTRSPDLQNAFLANDKLGLEYTMDDLRAGKPLPDPFPYKDDGIGVWFPDANNPGKGRIFAPIAQGLGRRTRGLPLGKGAVTLWKQTGNDDVARDAALFLIGYALRFPTIEWGDFLQNVYTIPQYQGRDYAARQRDGYAMWLGHYADYMLALQAYDLLFDYIQGNEELAQSVSRFVPWVKSSEDLIELLDVYLVQTTAKRMLRYQYVSHPTGLAEAATILGDSKLTEPWMDWVFSRTLVYPLAPAGIQDYIVSGTDREGPKPIGSTFYAQGDGAGFMVGDIENYILNGGDQKFDLSDPKKFPKPLYHALWQLNTVIAGHDFIRIGDVGGPDKTPGFTMRNGMEHAARLGWKNSRDPRFAWILTNLYPESLPHDGGWDAVKAAAAKVPRAPWLDLGTRHVDNWFTVLESGLEHDDPRFRRAAYLRTGIGHGHAHADALDLQVVGLGLPMTVDGGQRSGYSKPNDRFGRIHNLVEVDGGEGLASYAWPATLFDGPGVGYLRAEVENPPAGTKVYERQLALVDVDEGQGSAALPTAQQLPNAKLPDGVTAANSYVVDVFRVSGGRLHTYCFHAMVQDEFAWNAQGVGKVADVEPKAGVPEDDAAYLSIFSESPESKEAGTAPELFEATWRYLRAPEGEPRPAVGSEQTMLGPNFDPDSPRKFTRLSVLDAAGLRALKADVVCLHPPIPYRFTNSMLQRRAKDDGPLDSVFTAIIEPFEGEPFVVSKRLLPVADNEEDALRAVAVEAQTVNGHTDVSFFDGRPRKERRVTLDTGEAVISGEFAFLSQDDEGLRLAALAGGVKLESPEFRIGLEKREFTAKIVEADLFGRTFWTDKPVPDSAAGGILEVLAPGRRSAFTIESVEPSGAGSKIVVTRSPNCYSAPVASVDPGSMIVRGSVGLPVGRGNFAGLTLTNDDASKSWRIGQNNGAQFTVTEAVSEADFDPNKRLRVWELGAGDSIRVAATASLERTALATFRFRSNSPATVALRGSSIEISNDNGKTWQVAAPLSAGGGWAVARFSGAQPAPDGVLLRAK